MRARGIERSTKEEQSVPENAIISFVIRTYRTCYGIQSIKNGRSLRHDSRRRDIRDPHDIGQLSVMGPQ